MSDRGMSGDIVRAFAGTAGGPCAGVGGQDSGRFTGRADERPEG